MLTKEFVDAVMNGNNKDTLTKIGVILQQAWKLDAIILVTIKENPEGTGYKYDSSGVVDVHKPHVLREVPFALQDCAKQFTIDTITTDLESDNKDANSRN